MLGVRPRYARNRQEFLEDPAADSLVERNDELGLSEARTSALRSDSGNLSATVPAGNYRIEAASNCGGATIRGLVDNDGAPWAIQALSNTGNVRVSAG